jgi:dGTPase
MFSVENVPLSEYEWEFEAETERINEGHPGQDEPDKRGAYEHDRARIIHSVAFRRLQGKTQIFAPGWADFVRTRVTHSIEVAQIGRGLALRFAVPESLVEGVCLGHDLGHPPFGHTGEQALNACMEHHGGFEGNAQTFRIVTRLEEKSTEYRGLDLTRATLLGLIKYPYTRAVGASKYIYDDDVASMADWLYRDSGHGLLDAPDDDPPRTIVCDLMDWADDVAYSVHDLEDGLTAGILRPELWTEEEFVDTVLASATSPRIKWADDPPGRDEVAAVLKDAMDRFRQVAPVIHTDVIREVTRYYINRFANAGEIQQRGEGMSLFDYRLEIPREIRIENQVLKAITFEYVIRDERTTTFIHKGKVIVTDLWEELFGNAQDPDRIERNTLLPRAMRRDLANAFGDQSRLARIVCDYIASMTEGQAISLYGRLFETTGGSPVAYG